MAGSGFRNGLNVLLVLLAAAALAGCSASASTTGNQNPPADQPPSDPPAEEPVDPSVGPSVSLAAADTAVPPGDTVTLTWNSRNASSCSAGGGWSGAKATQGTAVVGPIAQSTTFSLTCSGDGGNAVSMISVSMLGVVTLDWDPPDENVDGSPLHDLAGYRIHYGELSGSYTDEVAVADSANTQYEMTLPSGSYYFAMTALDAEGNESNYSNEVMKVVN